MNHGRGGGEEGRPSPLLSLRVRPIKGWQCLTMDFIMKNLFFPRSLASATLLVKPLAEFASPRTLVVPRRTVPCDDIALESSSTHIHIYGLPLQLSSTLTSPPPGPVGPGCFLPYRLPNKGTLSSGSQPSLVRSSVPSSCSFLAGRLIVGFFFIFVFYFCRVVDLVSGLSAVNLNRESPASRGVIVHLRDRRPRRPYLRRPEERVRIACA